MEKEKKYLVYSGWVTSRADGEEHFITDFQVAKLFRVDLEECIFAERDRSYRSRLNATPLFVLRPQVDGNYTLR